MRRRVHDDLPHENSVLNALGDVRSTLFQLGEDVACQCQHRDAHIAPLRWRFHARRLSLLHLFFGERQKLLGVVDGDGEGNSGRDFHRVDADCFAVKVHKWAAGVSKSDGGVSLNVVDVVALNSELLRRSLSRGDDARSDGVA